MSIETVMKIASRRWKDADGELAWRVYRASGLSMAAFCRKTSVKRCRMDWWKAKHRGRVAEASGGRAPVFHPVRLSGGATRMRVEVPRKWVAEVVVNECRVRVPVGFEEEELGRLLTVLRGTDI